MPHARSIVGTLALNITLELMDADELSLTALCSCGVGIPYGG
jgi:hypothetical protein